MRISTRGDYASRALLSLALHADTGPTSVRDIADRTGLPQPYLEQILLALKGAGLVRSKRGVGGGYVLSRPPEEILLVRDRVGRRRPDHARRLRPTPPGRSVRPRGPVRAARRSGTRPAPRCAAPSRATPSPASPTSPAATPPGRDDWLGLTASLVATIEVGRASPRRWRFPRLSSLTVDGRPSVASSRRFPRLFLPHSTLARLWVVSCGLRRATRRRSGRQARFDGADERRVVGGDHR